MKEVINIRSAIVYTAGIGMLMFVLFSDFIDLTIEVIKHTI